MKKLYPIIIVVFLFAILIQRHFPSVLFNNIGRLIWMRADDDNPATAVIALPYFERAITASPGYTQARIGAALINILIDNEDAAFAHWSAGEIDPSILVAYGDKENNDGDLNKALLYYRYSARLATEDLSAGHFLAGNICQRTFNRRELLSNDNQEFCKNYFSDNKDNLFVNADFGSGDLSGWVRRYWSGFSGRYLVNTESDDKPNVAFMQGKNDKEVGAISQYLTIQEGTTIRFSAKIKAELQREAEVRLLHIVWTRQNGEPGGNQSATIDEDMEWGYVERTLKIPLAEGSSFTFSPAILTGRGEVWIDDVRLEIVPEN